MAAAVALSVSLMTPTAPLLLRKSKVQFLSLCNWCMSCIQRSRSLTDLPQPAKAPDHFAGVFTVHHDPHPKPDKEEEKKVKGILERLRHYGINNIVESNVDYALRAKSSQGDPETAFKLLMLLEDTYEGIVRPYNPNVKLLGAVNREAVTCFLDSLLFAMFVRLDSFEAMLYDNFDDAKRKRLAGLLRLWVNMLRSGRLITTDITAHIQRALADCGWADAGMLKQQDPSEAFTFITGQLELPMLTLKMDMYHTGKEDPQDDHKFINERLLEVAILDAPVEGREVITLEDCLEHYFNNRIEVKRHLENQRRNTLKSISIPPMDGDPTKIEKESGTHVEVLEVPETPVGTPSFAGTPISETPTQSKMMTPVEKLRPTLGRKRADSIFSQRKIELTGIDPEQLNNGEQNTTLDPSLRKMSTRTEVLMPAWQFFKLLPWYTENMPTSDAQVAAHFSKKRPVLGICLKRYSYTNAGEARRLDTYVDIPLEIAVPDFVSDENMNADGPLMGNFRLMLQAVVCHRGVSLNSGHYICLSRGRKTPAAQQDSNSEERRWSTTSDDMEDPWMRLDDLANPRVSYVDIQEALKKETPYLLFYQVQPIGDDGHSIHDLPTYAEATSRSHSDAVPLEKMQQPSEPPQSENRLSQVMSEPAAFGSRPPTGVADFVSGPERTNLDNFSFAEPPRGRTPAEREPEPRRKSITIDTTSSTTGSIRTDNNSNSVPSTPTEEKGNGLLSVANKFGSRRGSRVSKTSASEQSRSRPSSRDNINRFTLNMSKLTQMVSNKSDATGEVPVAQSTNPAPGDVRQQQKVADPPQPPPPPPATAPRVLTSANPSKESVAIPKSQPKLRKEKAVLKRKTEKHEDRDCVLM